MRPINVDFVPGINTDITEDERQPDKKNKHSFILAFFLLVFYCQSLVTAQIVSEDMENYSSRSRFNIPYEQPDLRLKSGNFTDNSAVDIRGITNQFRILAGVVFNGDYECATDFPFQTASSYEKTQMLYLASEIGPAPKTFNLLELARKVTGSSVVSNFTVRLMHTSLPSFNGLTNYVDMTGGQTVFSRSSYTIPDGSGTCGTSPDNNFTWMTINFDNNFVYNGTDNLIVEINWGPQTSGTTSRSVLAGDYPEQRVIYGYSDSANPSRDGNSSRRPNMRFGYQVPVFGTVSDMVNEFIQGCATVSNVSYSGDNRAIGFFERRAGKTEADFPFGKGIVLSTGQVTDAAGPNSSGSKTTQFGTAGSSDISSSYDAAKLSFNFVPNAASVSFRYVFASDEFTEYCGDSYNDAFRFYISGPGVTRQNIARLPNNNFVTINNICSSIYYVSNPAGSYTIEFDGRSVVLTASINNLQECGVYTLEMIIADVTDSKWDSGIFLESESFGSVAEIDFDNFNYEETESNTLYMACNPNRLRVKRPADGDLSSAVDVPVTVGGTAIYGTHHDLQSQTVTIPAGEWYVDIPYNLLNNPISGGMATIVVSTPGGCPCGGSTISKTITLYETYEIFSATSSAATSCTEPDGEINIRLSIKAPSNFFQFTYVLKDADGNSIASYSTSENVYLFSGLDAGTYIVEVYDDVSCTFLQETGIIVDAPGLPTVTCPGNSSVCLNDPDLAGGDRRSV